MRSEAATSIQGGSIVLHKQKEGKGITSRVLMQDLSRGVSAGLRAYPTQLGQGSLWLEYPAMEGVKELRLTIYDSQARKMADRVIKVSGEGGKERLNLNSGQWPAGMYYLYIQSGSTFHQQKLIK